MTEEGTEIFKGEKYYDIAPCDVNTSIDILYIVANKYTTIDRSPTTKFFSNKDNAQTYLNELIWKDKLKFKVGEVVIMSSAAKPTNLTITGIDYLKLRYNDITGSIPFSRQDLYNVVKEQTAEEKANELGFKIGDKVWSHKRFL